MCVCAGADVNRVEQDDNETALFIASRWGHAHVVKLLLAAGRYHSLTSLVHLFAHLLAQSYTRSLFQSCSYTLTFHRIAPHSLIHLLTHSPFRSVL